MNKENLGEKGMISVVASGIAETNQSLLFRPQTEPEPALKMKQNHREKATLCFLCFL